MLFVGVGYMAVHVVLVAGIVDAGSDVDVDGGSGGGGFFRLFVNLRLQIRRRRCSLPSLVSGDGGSGGDGSDGDGRVVGGGDASGGGT